MKQKIIFRVGLVAVFILGLSTVGLSFVREIKSYEALKTSIYEKGHRVTFAVEYKDWTQDQNSMFSSVIKNAHLFEANSRTGSRNGEFFSFSIRLETFFGKTRVEDWGRFKVYKNAQTKDGKSFNVMGESRVEVLSGKDKGKVIEDNKYYLEIGKTARFFDLDASPRRRLSRIRAARNLDVQMGLMMRWFEGRFDNYQQTYFEKQTKAEIPHEHIHSIFHRVKLPQISENVFYVQQYMDGDPKKIYRQRLYSFTKNEKEKAIQLTIFNFKDGKNYLNSHEDDSKLSKLQKADLISIPGCEVYWRLKGRKFEGSMKKNGCKVKSRRSGKTIIISDDLFLTKDEIWIRDKAVDEQGNYVFGHKGNIHHKLKKVRWFKGWTAVLKEGAPKIALEDFPREAYKGNLKLKIHDQGQIVKVNDKYSIQLAALLHSSKLEVLTLKVIENASGKTLSYTWTQPKAKRIGINLRWMQAGLTLIE